MIPSLGEEQLGALLLARAPARSIDTWATPSPDDVAALVRLRDVLAALALSAPPVKPPERLREAILARRPRPLRPERPVLLVLDMIRDHLTPSLPLEVPRARTIVPALARRIGEARGRQIPIVYACDVHPEDDQASHGAWPPHAVAGTEGSEVIPELYPERGDHVVRKSMYSAFEGSELGAVLESLGADELILTGCATEVGVRATATDALQRGLCVTIPEDGHAGGNPITEQLTMLVLGAMPPYDPIYLRRRR